MTGIGGGTVSLVDYRKYEYRRKTKHGEIPLNPCVRSENRRITPPTDKQLQFIDLLVKELEEQGTPVDYILDGSNYAKSSTEASRIINQLKNLRERHGYVMKHHVQCINIETGEKRDFIVPKAKSAPKGWKWNFTYRSYMAKDEE